MITVATVRRESVRRASNFIEASVVALLDGAVTIARAAPCEPTASDIGIVTTNLIAALGA
jgi:hypothetical protein